MRSLGPPDIRPPFAAYSHGVEVPAGLRWACTSGQLGLTKAEELPEGAYAQAVQCLKNCAAILAEAWAMVSSGPSVTVAAGPEMTMSITRRAG